MPGQRQQPTRPDTDDDEEGPAEEAPEDEEEPSLPTTPVLPPPEEEAKELELIQLDGYFRMRGDWFRRLDLGFVDDPEIGGAPFPSQLGCRLEDGGPCNNSFTTANMRLRFDPVVNITERTSVHAQIDVLDNLVLGSTPSSFTGDESTALDAFSRSQVPPEAGRNSRFDDVRVKRAWGEVETPIGLLSFGRQPEHWGMGMFRNSGGFDPIHGEYNYDADFGDTVDRVMFSAQLPGTNLRGAIARDWASTAPSAGQTSLFEESYYGQPWNLENSDDLEQWVFVLSRLDSPEVFEERLAEGDLGLNYGVYFTYRSQDWAQRDVVLGETPPADSFVPRDAQLYMPNVWGRVGYGDMELEVEAVSVLGSIDSVADLDIDGQSITDDVDVRQFGGVGRFTYKLLGGDLELSGETGIATGDQYTNDPRGRINVRNLRELAISADDTTVRNFLFNPDYHIDMILFRELLGTVTNATYVKPTMWWQIFDQLDVEGTAIASFANNASATPGDAGFYGLELNARANYRRDGFTAGLGYGVLFPGAALDFPDDPDAFGENAGSAGIAQTIQAHMILHF